MRLASSRLRTPLLVAALAAAFGGWFTQLPRATAAPPAQTCGAANLPAGFVRLPVRTLTRLPPTIARTATGGIRLDPNHWVAAQVQDANLVAVWNRADPYLPPSSRPLVTASAT